MSILIILVFSLRYVQKKEKTVHTPQVNFENLKIAQEENTSKETWGFLYQLFLTKFFYKFAENKFYIEQ